MSPCQRMPIFIGPTVLDHDMLDARRLRERVAEHAELARSRGDRLVLVDGERDRSGARQHSERDPRRR